MSIDIVSQLAEDLQRAHSGEAWHGPALAELLGEVSAEVAAARPVTGAHAIWEIVLHLTSWTREVTRRLHGAPPQLPIEGDWPPVDAHDEPAWDAACAALAEANAVLVRAVRALPASRLGDRIGPSLDAPLGTGVSLFGMVAGLVQHHAYHGGQIVLLTRAAAARAGVA